MKIKLKKTPILFSSILFIPFLIYKISSFTSLKENGIKVILVEIFAAMLISNLIILLIEQLSLRKIKALKKVWIVEIALILLIILFSIYFTD